MLGEIIEELFIYQQNCQMSSNQLVHKRLNSLKNITEQLKNSTTNGPYNFSHIKSLLGNLKHISQIPTQPVNKQEENDRYPFAYTEPSQQINSQNTLQEEEYRPLFQEKRKKQNKTFNKSFQESEIIDLRQENLRLEEKLAGLRDELYQLKQKSDRTIEEKESSKLPFFSLREPLQVFICRYEISEQNYAKIEYTQYEVQLKLDRLVLIKKQKNSLEELDLSTLINVKYIDSQHILFIFEEFVQSELLNLEDKDQHARTELTYLFVKFNVEQTLHKWDLSLFMNFNIVNSLHQSSLFQPYFRRLAEERKVLREKNDITEIRQSKQLDDKKEKDLLKILIKRRQEYLEIRTLIQEKLGHTKLENHNNQENQPQQKSPQTRRHPDIPEPLTLMNRTDRASFSSQQKNKKKIQNKNWQETQYNSMSPSIIEQIGEVQSNLQKSHHQNESRMNYSPSFAGLATTQSKNFRPQSEVYPFGQMPYQSENNFKSFPSNASTPRVKHLSINSKINKSVSDWPENRVNSLTKSKQIQNRVTAARQNLQNGYYATKYSKDGFYPHQKKIFLSLDCKKLCWSEKDKESDYKGIPLEVVTKIEYPAVGEGIKKHVKSPQPKYYCVIEYFSGEYKKKTIELGSGNYEEIKKFTQQLQLTVNNQRGIPLGGMDEQ